MYQKVDTKGLIGQRFGKLLVQEYSHFKNNKHYYKCLCELPISGRAVLQEEPG